ncbi:response regulator transcription factor [Winogradskyella maritima]|uniref:LytR/AlgR family response regulator transcription factor n=1 Tax=Winogradskyella maritima TaxID=1517766 RepID=A0ABV8AJG9_9FLAO|nr:response regulator transcription factor [Winogradskyella maritima]
MHTISIYIVEDEPLIVSTIETALLKQGHKIVGDAEDTATALKEINILDPDLVLIDIQLDGHKDGIDLAFELDKRQQPYLYLTSQTDPNTITRVKQTNPLGYIVKPFTENGLRSNIELAWHTHTTQKKNYLIFKSNGKLRRLNQDSILYLKAFDNYCYVVTAFESYLVPHTLKYMSEDLDSTKFIKTHRSFWVNMQHIESIDKSTVMVAKHKIPLSSSNKNSVLAYFKMSN